MSKHTNRWRKRKEDRAREGERAREMRTSEKTIRPKEKVEKKNNGPALTRPSKQLFWNVWQGFAYALNIFAKLIRTNSSEPYNDQFTHQKKGSPETFETCCHWARKYEFVAICV